MTLPDIAEPLPTSYAFGKVVGRVIHLIADTDEDTDDKPQARAAAGKVTFTPKDVVRRTTDANYPAIVLHAAETANLSASGRVLDGEGRQGIWLAVGVYTVSFAISGSSRASIPTFDIEVTADHTDAAPLDLATVVPYVPPTGTVVQTVLIPAGGTEGQTLLRTADGGLAWGPVGAVDSVNGQTGVVVLDAADIGAQPAGDYATSAELSNGLATKVNSSTYTAVMATKADLVDGAVPDGQLPDRLTDTSLRAASVAAVEGVAALNLSGAVDFAAKPTVGGEPISTSGIVKYNDASASYPEGDGPATYVGQWPPPEDRDGLYIYDLPARASRYFSGIWQEPLADDHPVEDRAEFNGTADLTNNRAGTSFAYRFAQQANYHTQSTPVAGFYALGDMTVTSTGAAPLFIVPTPDHPRQPVIWRFDNDTDAPPGTSNGLPEAFAAVPMPQGPNGELFEDYYGRTIQAAGGDGQAVVYDPFTDEMWEFQYLRWEPARSRYEMSYGGYTANASTAPEAYPNLWGARATSLPLMQSNVLRVEWEEGVIRHPLGVGIAVVDGFIPPATREDAVQHWNVVDNDSRHAISEGAWFRLPADFVVDENKYPGNPEKSQLYAMFLRAARDYGIVVNDGTGGTMSFSIEGDNAVGTPYSPLATSSLPTQDTYEGGLYYGNQNHLLDFPWDQLVQLKYTAPEEG